MPVRRTVLATSVLALSLVFYVAAAAAGAPSERSDAADDADQSAPDGERAEQRLAGVERVHGQLQQLVVLRPARRPGLLPGRPAAEDDLVPEAAAEHDVQLLGDRDRRGREPVGQQQHRHPHHSSRHDTAELPDALGDRCVADADLGRLDDVSRQRDSGLLHAPRQRQPLRRGDDRFSIIARPRPLTVDDVRVQGQSARRLRQHRREQRRVRDDATEDRQHATDGARPTCACRRSRPRPRSGSTGISRRTTPIRSHRSSTTST